jgi:hypothetical protein
MWWFIATIKVHLFGGSLDFTGRREHQTVAKAGGSCVLSLLYPMQLGCVWETIMKLYMLLSTLAEERDRKLI